MIHIRGLTYTYPGATLPILRNIDLDIAEGSFTLIVGPSGCGKSTLVRCLGGLVPHFSGGIVQGMIRVDQHNPITEGPSGMSHYIGYVFQDPEAQAIMERVEDEIAFALEHTGMPYREMRVRVEQVLDLLDLAALRDRSLEQLSGGERQRVAIAAALALQPRILVLDEPTSQLDPQSADDVLQSLVRLNTDTGLTIVIVEHRLERVLPFVEQVVYLAEDGIRAGTPEAIMPDLPLSPPLIALGKALGWSPLPLTIKAGLRFSRKVKVPAVAPQTTTAVHRASLLELRHVEFAYGQRTVLRDVSLTIGSGEIVALLGRNGAGKTTLLKCLVGLLRPTRGRALTLGQDNAGRDIATICQHVGYLPQNPNALLFAETVREELEITLRNHGIADDGIVDRLLELLNLAAKSGAFARDLSVGERQRVALGAILVTKPRALLLDEPTRGLDYLAKRVLAQLLHDWRDQGMAILLVTHDVEFAASLADRVAMMGHGDMIAEGPAATVLGASPLFAPQIARLFPGSGWLTFDDVLHGLTAGGPPATLG